MAFAVKGWSKDPIALDYKFAFIIADFYSLEMGKVVLSNVFTYCDGDSWQLEVTKTIYSSQIQCRLQLFNESAGIGVPKLVRLSFPADKEAKNSSSAALFYGNGEQIDFGSLFIPTGCEDLKVEVEVTKLRESVKKPQKPQIKPPKSQMAAVVLKWFLTEDFGDTTIVAADGNKFRCHRDILAARSEVFSLLLNCPIKKNLVNIEYDGEIVASLLEFIYIDECCDIGQIADQLYIAADHYQLERLKILCESSMAANLSAKTVVKTYRLAKSHNLDMLLASCVDYLHSNKIELPIEDLLAEALKIQDGNEGEADQDGQQ